MLFTGNAQENGDANHAGALMGLIRLSDAPIIAGADRENLIKANPQAKSGPVLKLPHGWEPCWTFHEIFPAQK